MRDSAQRQLQKIAGRYPADREALLAAGAFALERHSGQHRKSGEEFIYHPLAVAAILAEEGLGPETVAAGLLHDVIEDTDADAGEIASRFGAPVARLVEGVSKVEQLRAPGSSRAKLATYRKLLIAAADDARVLVIKLADRVHNMRTIAALPKKRATEIAAETLEVYAPLAHRLGMSWIKTELEDRALAVLDPRAYEEAGMIQSERQKASKKEMQRLQRKLRKELHRHGVEAVEIKSRIKSRYSIAEKLRRRGGEREAIADVVGLRVIVKTVDQCYLTLGVVHSLWPPKSDSFDDYIAVPRANLYRSLHTTVIVAESGPVEIQIRTVEQDEIAERGIAAHWLYKSSLREGGPALTQRHIAAMAAGQREAGNDLDEAFERLRADVFDDEIYVLTPAGDVRLLPTGSCAIDFAYSIHSELGDRIAGARIDGKLAPITTPLSRGAVVEIISSKGSAPSLDWLAAVKTARARSRIRSYFADELDSGRTGEGYERIASALRSIGLVPLADPERLPRALVAAGYADPEAAARLALRDRGQLRSIVRAIAHSAGHSEPRPTLAEATASAPTPAPAPPSNRKSASQSSGDLIVAGLDGVETRLAGCCSPEPGDLIRGYVSLGRGVSVHRRSCPNIAGWMRTAPERLVDVSWAAGGEQGFLSVLEVRFIDRPELLGDIATTVYAVGSELEQIELRADRGVVRGQITARVVSADATQRLRAELAALDGALVVRRRGASRSDDHTDHTG